MRRQSGCMPLSQCEQGAKNLEEEYHLRIFERSSTGMIPTEQGRHFIEQAERVLREVDRLDRSVQERRSAAPNCG